MFIIHDALDNDVTTNQEAQMKFGVFDIIYYNVNRTAISVLNTMLNVINFL